MILLKSIKFVNWGPWPKLSLDKKVVNNSFENLSNMNNFIYGSNNSGKSSLINALMWVFIEKLMPSDDNTPKDDVRYFLNRQAVDNGDHEFSVFISLEDTETKEYIDITRIQELPEAFKENAEREKLKLLDYLLEMPKSDLPESRLRIDFKDSTGKIKGDDRPQKEYLQKIFPPELKDHFFILGEKILEKKDPLQWKDSLEKVLGLSLLDLFSNVVHRVSSTYNLKNMANTSTNKKRNGLITEISNAEKIKTQEEGLVKSWDGDLVKFNTQLENLMTELKGNDKFAPTFTKLALAEDKLNTERDAVTLCLSELKSSFKDIWKVCAFEKIIKLRHKDDELNIEEKDFLRSLNVLKSKESKSFDTNLLNDKTISDYLLKILDLNREHLNEKSNNYEQYKSGKTYTDILDLHKNYLSAQEALKASEYTVNTIKRDLPSGMKQQDRDDLKDKLETLGKLKKQISKADEERLKSIHIIQEQANIIAKKGKELATIEIDKNDKTQIYLKMTEQLKNIIIEAKNRARSKVHKQYEDATNQIHDSLKDPATKSNTKIKISHEYEAKLIDINEDGSEVHERNPATSQVIYVMMSMNLALLKVAIHKLPLILDNPFVPLDPDAKERFLKTLAKNQEQKLVTLFESKKHGEQDLEGVTHWSQVKKNDPTACYYAYAIDVLNDKRTIIEAKE
tara:strand:- start:941 stop:2980 length:2040 start_codon:yes stop_codon:yes gene_type:complete